MSVPRLHILSVIVTVLATTSAYDAKAQADEFLDGLLAGDNSTSALSDWKAFIELMPRRYTHSENGRIDSQLIVWSELEAEFRFNEKLTAYARPRLYADIGQGHFERWQLPDAYLTYATDTWDVRGGLFVENWGVADTFSPLDILNPRDFATEFLDPLKIGQPGFRLRRLFEGGKRLGEPTLSLYWMPEFRSARYAPPGQRLHPGTVTSAFDRHGETQPSGHDETFWGLRYQSTINAVPFNADLQIVATEGPDRSPPIHLFDNGRLSPAQQRVTTLGLGLRGVPSITTFGHFLSTLTVKGEAVRRSFRRYPGSTLAAGDSYWTYVVGVNKEWPNLLRDQDELAITLEYLWDTDSAGAADQRLIQHDTVLRLLWQANNFSKTAMQLRAVIDADDDETVLEASYTSLLRTVSEDLTLEIRYQYFGGNNDATFLSRLPNNSSLAIALRWVFAKS